MAYKKIFGFNQRRAFKRLVVNNRTRLYRMAYAWTSDPHLADDLVQQTLLKALSNQKQFAGFCGSGRLVVPHSGQLSDRLPAGKTGVPIGRQPGNY